MVLFVDTNFFVQLRPPAELLWKEICQDDELLIIVPRAVQKEISRLKGDGNSRRAKRARSAAALLMRIAKSEAEREQIRGSNPRVYLALPRPETDQPAMFPDTPASADDQIIAEMLAFVRLHPTEEVALLTSDSDQVLSCKHHGLQFRSSPDEWHLAPEPDARDKQLQDLRTRIERLETDGPVINVLFCNADGREITDAEIELNDFGTLTAEDLDELVAEAKEIHPQVGGLEELVNRKQPTDFIDKLMYSTTDQYRFKSPTLEDVRRYREVAYPGWLEQLSTFLSELPKILGRPTRLRKFKAVLRNVGTRPAQGTVVRFFSGEGWLSRKEDGERVEREFPLPPDPPRRTVASISSALEGLGSLRGLDPFSIRTPDLTPLSPYAFYRSGTRGISAERLEFQCDQFRHGNFEQHLEFIVAVPFGAELRQTEISCEVSANNLSLPVRASLPISVKSHHVDAVASARELLRLRLGQRKA